MFAVTSRYYNIPTTTYTTSDGRAITYARRRMLPDPASLTPTGTHLVRDGERLDHIAAAELGDPELFWRIADAHRVLDPAELTQPGRLLLVTLPAGMPYGAPTTGVTGG